MNEGLASNQLIYVRPQRVAIGKAVVTLAIVVVILSGTLTLLIVTPESIVHQAIATATTTTTITKITSNATTKATLGAQSQCVFTQTCGAVSASGLELILSLNQTTVRPNGTLTVSVTELNTLPTTNNVSSSSEWRLSKLKWLYGCGPPGYIPHGIELFNGYYTLGNVTSASPNLRFWGGTPCPAESLIGLDVGNVTSYAFQPNSDNASYSAHNKGPSSLPNPASMRYRIDIFAGTVNLANVNQISSTSSKYTLVAGDEWGALVLLHFSVRSS